MTFQVLKDGVIKMQIKHAECVPSEEQQKQMKKAGYKFKTIKEKEEK